MSTISTQPEATPTSARDDFQPVAAYGLIADCNSAALVDRDGSVSWLCWPRYDSPAVFARILDRDGGHFVIRPRGSYMSERRYVPETLVIDTTLTTARVVVKLNVVLGFAAGRLQQ